MALARVSTGDPGVASNIDQFVDLLTGVMTDQPVIFGNAVTANDGVKLGSAAPGAGPDIRADGTNIYIETNGAGGVYFRPNGYGSAANQGSYTSAGLLSVVSGSFSGTITATGVATFNGGLSSTTGTFSGTIAVSGVATFNSNLNLPNVGTTFSNSGGAGFIIDRGSFSRAYTGSGNDNSSRSTNLNFNGRTPTIVGSCTNQAAGSACNFSMTISGNTINLTISSGDSRTYNFNWIAVG